MVVLILLHEYACRCSYMIVRGYVYGRMSMYVYILFLYTQCFSFYSARTYNHFDSRYDCTFSIRHFFVYMYAGTNISAYIDI